MGITGLYPFVHKKVPDGSRPVTLADLKGKTVVLDTKGFIYKLCYGSVRQYTHLVQIANLYCDLIRAGIKPIFVFDGKPPKQKQAENERRHELKQTFLQNLQQTRQQIADQKRQSGFDSDRPLDNRVFEQIVQAGDQAKIASFQTIQRMEDDLEKETTSRVIVTMQQVKECKELLSLMGCWVLTAKGEAEADCSIINRLGLAYCVASEDGDVFGFGAKKLLRGIGGESNRERNMRLYDIDHIIDKLGLTKEQMVDVCVLSPNDYNKTSHIKKMGISTAYNAIAKHQSIENFVLNLVTSPGQPSMRIPGDFDYVSIRQIFMEAHTQKKLPDELLSGNRNKFCLNKVAEYLFALPGFLAEQGEDCSRQLSNWTRTLRASPLVSVESEQQDNCNLEFLQSYRSTARAKDFYQCFRCPFPNDNPVDNNKKQWDATEETLSSQHKRKRDNLDSSCPDSSAETLEEKKVAVESPKATTEQDLSPRQSEQSELESIPSETQRDNHE